MQTALGNIELGMKNIRNIFFDNYVTTSFDIAYSMSKALDLVNPMINNHHQRVAFIAGSIAKEAGLSCREIENTVIASLLHDIGVVVEQEFHELVNESEAYENEFCHVMVGSFLLEGLKLFPGISMIVKYHHTPYGAKSNPLSEGEDIPETAYIVHLADRIDILLDRTKPALEQRHTITEKIMRSAKYKFMPEHLEAFMRLAVREHFWFDIEEPEKYQLIKYNNRFSHVYLDLDGILETAKLLSRIIDFRCVFTSSHSAGVAAVAYKIAQLTGMTEKECKSAKIAGYLHDIGKLAIPTEILYKEGRLTEDEIQILRKHPYYTYTILNSFQIFDTIKEWAAYHHEHLDGTGYPFHLKADKLSHGSRLIAVADIFTALTELRPYRKPESRESLSPLLLEMARKNQLDTGIVRTVIENFDEINSARADMQKEASDDFVGFKDSIFTNKICMQNKNYLTVLNR